MDSNRLPPQAPRIEMALLGSILSDESAIHSVLEIFDRPQVFYREENRKIFTAILELFEAGKPIDIVSAGQALLDTDGDDGMPYYLSKLLDHAAPSRAKHYAEEVYQKYIARQAINLSTETVNALYDGEPPQVVLDRQTTQLYQILEGKQEDTVPFDEAIRGGLERIERELKNEGIVGLRTGLQDIDKRLMGIEAGDKIIIGGRPSNGKSSLMLNIALHIAKQDVPVSILSTETKPDRIGYRSIKQHGKGGSSYVKYASAIEHYPIYIRFGGLSEAQYRAWVSSQIHRHNTGLIIVDYIQEMRSEHRQADNRHKIDSIMDNIKSVTEETDVPVIVVSQLSRAAEGKVPTMEHLRETGYLEQAADKIITLVAASNLDQKEKSHYGIEGKTDKELTHLALANVCKVRDGSPGYTYLYCDPASFRYQDMIDEEPPF